MTSDQERQKWLQIQQVSAWMQPYTPEEIAAIEGEHRFGIQRLLDELVARMEAQTYEALVGRPPPNCPACDGPLPLCWEQMRFCIRCGAPLTEDQAPPGASDPPATGPTTRLNDR